MPLGLALIKLCKTYGIHIFNGRLHNDVNGNFTCVTHNGASIVDYIIASSCLFQYCTEFKIGDMYQSVHFPVTCKFKFNLFEDARGLNEKCMGLKFPKFKWNENKKDEFCNSFRYQFELVKHVIINEIELSTQEALQKIVDLYQTSANCMRTRNCGHPTAAENQWWDSQCDNVKRDKLHALNRFRSYPSSSNLSEYISHRNRLKNIV